MNKLQISIEERTQMREFMTELCCWNKALFLLFRSANKCTTKVAHMLAQLQQFQRAAELFEEVCYGRSFNFALLLAHSDCKTLLG